MTNYDKTFMLGAGQGSSQKTSNEYIIIHDTANDNNQGDNSAYNEASYMHNNWQNAYTHAIAGWDRVYLVGEAGYVAYGAGNVANSRAPFQIELAHYSDPAKQRQSYVNYVNAIREYANKFGIPLTLDGGGKGIKSHKWVSDNIWGDHQDPYGYLARIGISKQQLAHDLANGIGGTAPVPSKPASKPAPAPAQNQSGFKYAIGTKVTFGGVFSSSDQASKANANNGYTPANRLTRNSGVITRQLKTNGVSTYLIDNGFGWINDGDVHGGNPAPAPKPATSTGKWIAQKATFIPNRTLPLTVDASGNGALIANIGAGQAINYDAYMIDSKYVWIRQPRGNGYGYMATGNAKNGKRVDYWGSFK